MGEPIAVVFPRRHEGPWIPRVPRVRPKVQPDPVKPISPQSIIPRLVNPVTGDRIYDADEAEFLMAVDRFKRERNKRFPSLTELLAILRSLGYVKLPVEPVEAMRMVAP